MAPRTIAEFEALTGTEALKPGERKLIADCRVGQPCILGDERPTEGTVHNTIRADLLRVLITGGTAECGLHEAGVVLVGSWITGQLDFRYSRARGQTVLGLCNFTDQPQMEQAEFQLLKLDGSLLPGLEATGLNVVGSLFLRFITSFGTVDVTGANIGGQFSCHGATIDGNGGTALGAQRVRVGADLFLNAVNAIGTVAVNSAIIDGQLGCISANFDGKGNEAINAQGAKVGADIFLSKIKTIGVVDLVGADIGGQLACDEAILDGNGGHALNARAASVRESFLLCAVKAAGVVELSAANIGGQLDCSSATLVGKGGKLLVAQGVRVGDCFVLRSIVANGTVDLSGANIVGHLFCDGATFDGMGREALIAQHVKVEDAFLWRQVKRVCGSIDLNGAHVSDLVDDIESWPKGANELILDGFSYDRIAAAPSDPQVRLPWLQAGSTFHGVFRPQPYTQLAKVLGQMGKRPDANDILVERDRLLARHYRHQRLANKNRTGVGKMSASALNFGLALWDWVNRETTGYGYKPLRSLGSGLIIYSVAVVLAHFCWIDGDMTPNSDVILTSPEWRVFADDPAITMPAELWTASDQAGRDWETFSAFGYALDLVVPLLDLGQTDAWAPSPARGLAGTTLWFMRWILSFAGWLVSGLAVAAISASIKQARD